MKRFCMTLFVAMLIFVSTNAFAISSVETYEKLARLEAVLGESRVSRAELMRAYVEAKAAEESYSLNHKDKLMGLFALAMAQLGAAKASLEAGADSSVPMQAASETMKKIRGMIRRK